MPGKLDYDRLFLNRKAAIVLGVAATLALAGDVAKFWNFNPAHPSQMVIVAAQAFAVAATFGALGLFGAMGLYWLKCDTSSKRGRATWFAVLLLGLFYGAPLVLYFLAVYLPAVRNRLRGVEWNSSGSDEGAELRKKYGVFRAFGWALLTGWVLIVLVVIVTFAFSRPIVHFPRLITANMVLIVFLLLSLSAAYGVMFLFRIGTKQSTG